MAKNKNQSKELLSGELCLVENPAAPRGAHIKCANISHNYSLDLAPGASIVCDKAIAKNIQHVWGFVQVSPAPVGAKTKKPAQQEVVGDELDEDDEYNESDDEDSLEAAPEFPKSNQLDADKYPFAILKKLAWKVSMPNAGNANAQQLKAYMSAQPISFLRPFIEGLGLEVHELE
jgi:hypothetical protein